MIGLCIHSKMTHGQANLIRCTGVHLRLFEHPFTPKTPSAVGAHQDTLGRLTSRAPLWRKSFGMRRRGRGTLQPLAKSRGCFPHLASFLIWSDLVSMAKNVKWRERVSCDRDLSLVRLWSVVFLSIPCSWRSFFYINPTQKCLCFSGL